MKNKKTIKNSVPGKTLNFFLHIYQSLHCMLHLSSSNLSPFFFFSISLVLHHGFWWLWGSPPDTSSTLSAFHYFLLGLILVILPQVLPYWEGDFYLKLLPHFCCIYCNNLLLWGTSWDWKFCLNSTGIQAEVQNNPDLSVCLNWTAIYRY